MFSTTLLADLSGLDFDATSVDPLEVVAACVRHREAALLCLQYDGLVWPVTMFPNESLYHSPRDFADADDVDGVSAHPADEPTIMSMGDVDALGGERGMRTADLESDSLSDSDLEELDYKEA